jgi:hypothetical protein
LGIFFYNTISLSSQIRAPGRHIQLTNMISKHYNNTQTTCITVCNLIWEISAGTHVTERWLLKISKYPPYKAPEVWAIKRRKKEKPLLVLIANLQEAPRVGAKREEFRLCLIQTGHNHKKGEGGVRRNKWGYGRRHDSIFILMETGKTWHKTWYTCNDTQMWCILLWIIMPQYHIIARNDGYFAHLHI